MLKILLTIVIIMTIIIWGDFLKTAIIGSRILIVTDFEKYLPEGTTEIVTGGAKGIDSCAKKFAIKNKMKITEFLPEYDKYGRIAPLKRNDLIIDYSDMVIAFWDGKSKGTKYVINNCKRKNKPIKIYLLT